MVLLEALHAALATYSVLNRLNSLNCSQRSCQCGDVWHLVLEAGLADSLPVLGIVPFCPRCVDGQADFVVKDEVNYIRAPFAYLVHLVALDSMLVVELGCPLGCQDCEAQVLEGLSDGEHLLFLGVGVA